MSHAPIDELCRSLLSAASRRGVLAGLAGGLPAALSIARTVDAAAAKKKRRRRRRRKKKRQDTSIPSAPPAPVARIDATCGGPADTGVFAIGGDERFAQTFTAIASGPLLSAQLTVHKSPATAGDFVLRLSAVNDAGVPANDVLADSIRSNADVVTGESAVDFTFAPPATVVAGVQYAVILTRPGGGAFGWGGHVNDRCAGRAFYSSSPTGSFAEIMFVGDFIFTTVVRS